MKKCPLTGGEYKKSACNSCMYHVPAREPPCVFTVDLSALEFARLKGVTVDEMHEAAKRIKDGLILCNYAEFCQTNTAAEEPFISASKVYGDNPILSELSISESTFQRMCNAENWKAFKSKFNGIENTKISSILPIKKREYLSITSERKLLMAIKLRAYTISNLEQQPDHGPVYVINSTSGNKRGDVLLTVARTHGVGTDSVHIPMTWIPVDITSVVNRSQLIRDNNFRQAITGGMLRLVHPDDAQKLFETDPAAQAEFKRVAPYLLRGGMANEDDVQLDDGAIELNREEQDEHDRQVAQDVNEGTESYPAEAAVRQFLADVKSAFDNGEPSSDEVTSFCNRLRNFGELSNGLLKTVYSETKAICPEVAQTAKSMR